MVLALERSATRKSEPSRGILRRRAARSVTRFQLRGEFSKLAGDLAQERGGSPLRPWRYLFIDVLAKPRDLVVDSPADFFEFIHHLRVQRTPAAISVL